MVHVPGATMVYVQSFSHFSFCYKIFYYFSKHALDLLFISHIPTVAFFPHYGANAIFSLDMD